MVIFGGSGNASVVIITGDVAVAGEVNSVAELSVVDATLVNVLYICLCKCII